MWVKIYQYLSTVSGGDMNCKVFINSFKDCAECGKSFSTFLYDRQNYVYKTKEKDGIKYFCSYPCYRQHTLKKEGNERTR